MTDFRQLIPPEMPETSEKGLVDKPMTAVRASERTVAQLRIG
jgi:hypothetical protein